MKNASIQLFSQLGKILKISASNQEVNSYSFGLTKQEYDDFQAVIYKQYQHNAWFTEENVRSVLMEWGNLLNEENLLNWTQNYQFSNRPKRVGIIMAGNIPLVGFHDFLAVVLSGNIAVIKLSSDDKLLLPAILKILLVLDPSFEKSFELTTGKIGAIDAIIATGSNNSMHYFESYFGHLPHLFRKNRTSLAILDGTESKEDIQNLGKDIFTYFGLGCRNVSQLFIPKDFQINRFFEGIYGFSDIVNHNKYANNYDYNKAIHLMNQSEILDNGFVLLKEAKDLFSALAMVYYHRYESQEEISAFLSENVENIQAVIGKNYLPFGTAQCPSLVDYADGVDTMIWLEKLI